MGRREGHFAASFALFLLTFCCWSAGLYKVLSHLVPRFVAPIAVDVDRIHTMKSWQAVVVNILFWPALIVASQSHKIGEKNSEPPAIHQISQAFARNNIRTRIFWIYDRPQQPCKFWVKVAGYSFPPEQSLGANFHLTSLVHLSSISRPWNFFDILIYDSRPT